MKAAILNHYDKKGTDLEIRDIPVPVPEEDEVLVKIISAAVNPLDNMIIRGEVKLIVPYRMPLVMGNEFAGIVETMGRNVSGFQPGGQGLWQNAAEKDRRLCGICSRSCLGPCQDSRVSGF